MAQYPYSGTGVPNQPNVLFQQPVVPPSYPRQQTVYTVDSQEEAMNANLPGIFIDSQNPVIYMKRTDTMGRTVSFEIYDLVKREPNPGDSYVTRSEIEELFKQYLGPRNSGNYYKNHKKQRPEESEVKE